MINGNDATAFLANADMANSAEENQWWIQDRIAEAGLTEETELEALHIIQAREDMEGL